MKIAGTFAESKRLTTRPTIFMVGGAPTAHEVLPEKLSPSTDGELLVILKGDTTIGNGVAFPHSGKPG